MVANRDNDPGTSAEAKSCCNCSHDTAEPPPHSDGGNPTVVMPRSAATSSRIRGIRNVSGVSCHISAALQLIYHGLPEVSALLLNLLDAWPRTQREMETARTRTCDDSGDGIEERSSSPPPSSIEFVHQLSLLFEQLSSDHPGSLGPVDPTGVYETLPAALDHRNVGDAATALRVILATIRTGLEEMHGILNDRSWKRGMIGDDKDLDLSDTFLDANKTLRSCLDGSSVQRLVGEMVTIGDAADGRKVRKRITREKPSKERPWSSPLPLPVRGYDSLSSSLRSVTIEPQIIAGYNWDGAVDCAEKEEEICVCASSNEGSDGCSVLSKGDDDSTASSPDSSSSSFSTDTEDSSVTTSSLSSCGEVGGKSAEKWKTSKYTTFAKLPSHFIFHLKRFDYRLNRVEKISSVLDVPGEIDLRPYCKSQESFDLTSKSEERYSNAQVDAESSCDSLHYHYTLMGAILHNDTPTFSNDHDTYNDEGGHYITYISSSIASSHESTGKVQHLQTQLTKCKLDDPVRKGIEDLNSSDSSEPLECWVRIDDEEVVQVAPSERNGNILDVLSGRTSMRSKCESEVNSKNYTGRRYATVLLYSRTSVRDK